jgi:hypothetical protein
VSKRIIALAALALTATGAAGCGGTAERSPAPRPGHHQASATPLDGVYAAQLDREALRGALAPIKPPLRLPGGWWTLTVDTAAHRLVLSHPGEGDTTVRITGVDGSQIRLAPDPDCEQRGASRTRPGRLAWFRAGATLRLKAIDLPCLTDNVLLTLAAWSRA